MNVRGERIIIFGDSLSHHGRDHDPNIWDVNQGSNRSSSQPGDLLASLLAEQGAAAVRVNARVGRSGLNFWSHDGGSFTSDQAFRPTKVIIILGTNGLGGGTDAEILGQSKIAAAYKAMGAEVWGVGPFLYNNPVMNAQAQARSAAMQKLYGARFIDPRPFTATVGRAGDGVHFGPESARITALGLADTLLSTPSPKNWLPLALGAAAGIAGLLAWSWWRSSKRPALSGSTERSTAEIKATLARIRAWGAQHGKRVVSTKSRRGIEPSLIIDGEVYSIDSALALVGSKSELGALPKDVAKIAKQLNARQQELDANWRKYFQQAYDGTELVDFDERKAAYQREYDEIDEILIPLMPPKPKPAALKAAREYAKKLGLKGSANGALVGTLPPGGYFIVEDAIAAVPAAKRWGKSKVFIADVHAAYKKQGGDLSLEDFKSELVRLSRDGQIKLARADLVAAMDPKHVARSEADAGGATYHFVQLEGLKGVSDEIKQQTKRIRDWGVRYGKAIHITSARHGNRPNVVIDNKIYTLDEALAIVNAQPGFAGRKIKGSTWDEYETYKQYKTLMRDPDPATMDIVEDALLERGAKLSKVTRNQAISYPDGGQGGSIMIDDDVEHPTVVRWAIESGTKKRGKKGSNAYNWRPRLEIVYRGKILPGINFVNHPTLNQEYPSESPTREKAAAHAAAAAWAIAKRMKQELAAGRSAEDVQGEIVDENSIYAPLRTKYMTKKDLFGSLGKVDIVDGKRWSKSEAALVRSGAREVPCKSGLKNQARCWTMKLGLGAMRISAKDPATMTAAPINKELDKLAAEDSRLNQLLIDAGRGSETYNETFKKTDPLSMEWRAVQERRLALRREIELRYGPGAPSRMPPGFKPRKKAGVDGVDSFRTTKAVEYGTKFQTGKPVTFNFVRNTEKSPHVGARYGQDIEPHGRYLLHDHDPQRAPVGPWEKGKITFRRPLVISLSDDPNEIYGPKGWKTRLREATGKTGAALSRHLAKTYDGIVTVDETGNTREIIDLSRFVKATQ